MGRGRTNKDPRAAGRKGGFKSLGSNLPRHAYKGKGTKHLFVSSQQLAYYQWRKSVKD
jgi:hypothetical protein